MSQEYSGNPVLRSMSQNSETIFIHVPVSIIVYGEAFRRHLFKTFLSKLFQFVLDNLYVCRYVHTYISCLGIFVKFTELSNPLSLFKEDISFLAF
jgi:hypothetical protein